MASAWIAASDKSSLCRNPAIETMHNPKYPLELFMRVITVSLETIKIVNALPDLVIEGDA